MPYPPLKTHFASPAGSQANPTLGANAVFCVGIKPAGTPGSPGYSNPAGAVGNTFDCAPGTKRFCRLCISVYGNGRSYRSPKFKVSRELTLYNLLGFCADGKPHGNCRRLVD